jgi:hypothetical protein
MKLGFKLSWILGPRRVSNLNGPTMIWVGPPEHIRGKHVSESEPLFGFGRKWE